MEASTRFLFVDVEVCFWSAGSVPNRWPIIAVAKLLANGGKVVTTLTAAWPPYTGPGSSRCSPSHGPSAAYRGASGPASLPALAG